MKRNLTEYYKEPTSAVDFRVYFTVMKVRDCGNLLSTD
jgi:hypothetical protein